MAGLHTEANFEDELVGHLVQHAGWREGNASKYDRALALYTEDVMGWLEDTQPDQYAKVRTANNGAADRIILERLAKVIEEEGALTVLRKGFKRLNARFEMCAFKPGHGLNPQTLERYNKVRCRVVRQVRYSEHNENSFDIVLFVNGIPIATLELKTDFTQTIEDAVQQYRTARPPRDPRTGKVEPLLTFKRGALVHFAVSTDEVRMTTQLAGPETHFLPFNLGYDDGAGNPPNPDGFRTAYLWERVLSRDSLLEILEKYLHLEKATKEVEGKKVVVEQLIFPRYHQWDAVRNLIGASQAQGPGNNYLIQHSAGSGKSNTIMWLAHQLSSLHDAGDRKVFDSVIVVTDRTVLDDQLKEAIFQFEHKAGVVESITSRDGSKSAQLFKALENKTPIIVVTIQTFPRAVEAFELLKDISKRSFAVIADEAHSSQTGEAAKDLRESLGITDHDPETEEVSAEDAILAAASKRAGAKNISYFAFTATPKSKTLERFGRIGADGKPEPFHLYTMQQAIEEEFILDVLQHYTTYDVAHKLATQDETTGERIVPKSDAARLIARAARLHPYAIDQKVAIIVEHYRENIQPLLGGRAKAMVVCESRKAAVRYKLAIDEYIAEKGYSIATLVAFSGKVQDDVRGFNETFTENGMNGLKNEDIPEAFKTDRYQVLLVAEKYQTGFNQPLLVAMYVDKKLAGINAVQTLSRLNRTFTQGAIRKTDTFVLDFVNDGDEILAAFKPYYKKATMTGVTEPDLIHDLQSKLDKANVYTDEDIEAYFHAYVKAQGRERGQKRQSLLAAVLNPVVDRYKAWVKRAIEESNDAESQKAGIFRDDVSNFVRLYGFLSQIYDYADTDLEKRYLMFSGLARLLKDRQDQLPVDVSGVDMTHFKAQVSFMGRIDLKTGEAIPLKPIGAVGTANARQKQFGALAEVVRAMNDVFGAGIDEADQIIFAEATAERMVADPTLKDQALHNSYEQFRNAGDVLNLGQEMLVQTKEELVAKNERQNVGFEEAMLRLFGNKEGLARVLGTLTEYVYRHHHDKDKPGGATLLG